MSLSAEWRSDWACPYPFRVINIQSEHDAELGQWEIDLAILGISVSLTWVYDADTPLRQDLAEMMADDSWLTNARVTMTHAEYKELTAAADELAKLKAERAE